MECSVNGCVSHVNIYEKIENLMECDKIYIQFMESRLKIQEEQVEFLHRLRSFWFQFSITRKLYIKFRLFREECEDISEKISGVEKELGRYQKNFDDVFTDMIKSSIRRSANLKQLKMIAINNCNDAKLPCTELENNNDDCTYQDLLMDKENLENDWIALTEFADHEIMKCHSQLHILCKEFSR